VKTESLIFNKISLIVVASMFILYIVLPSMENKFLVCTYLSMAIAFAYIFSPLNKIKKDKK